MIYVRKFKVSDLLTFDPIESLVKLDMDLMQNIEDSGLAVTGIREGKIIGCGGVCPINDLHGEIWLSLNKDCLKYKIDTMRWLRDGLKIAEKSYPFKQLNASIQSCFQVGIRMVERLGFVFVKEMIHEEKQWLIYSKRVQR